VPSTTCPSCGAPTASGAQYCAYCGHPLTAASAAAPLPSTGFLPPPPPPTAAYGSPPPSPQRSRRRIVVIVAVAIVAIIASSFVAAELYAPTTYPIQVQYFVIFAPDNVCDLNSTPTAYYGYNDSTGSVDEFEFPIYNGNSTACTIRDVATNTTGFTLSQVQVPLTIPAQVNGTMNITVTAPGSPFTGNLNLIFL